MRDQINITSEIKDYTVIFAKTIDGLSDDILDKNAFYIIDKKVNELYPTILQNVDGYRILTLTSNEELKTLIGAEEIFDFFIKNNINKQSKIIALGGGVIQDVVTLATHIFHRGLSWTYVPTTLLAMSDSCIGAKSAINYKGVKNPLGVFHPPGDIFLYPGLIQTLSYSDLLSGYGEVIKLGLIGNKNTSLMLNINSVGLVSKNNTNTDMLEVLVKSSLMTKKTYIEEDEFDLGVRRILNYGHTFGHALESVMNNKIPHGQAVVIGIDIVNYISYRLGFLPENIFRECRCYYDKLYSDCSLVSFEVCLLLDRIKNDKKTSNGDILLALMRSPGDFFLKRVSIDGELHALFVSYLDNENIFKLKGY